MQKITYTIFITCLFLTMINPSLFGQQSQQYHSQTTSLVAGRYEIIASDYGAKFTFKVDKLLGYVYMLVKDSDGNLLWEKMHKKESGNDIFNPDKVNYQLYASGNRLSHTFLVNINTGATWMLVEDRSDKNNSLYWWSLMPTD